MTVLAAPRLAPAAGPARGPVARDDVPPFERGSVAVIATAFLAVELAVAARYGIHRDELYFLACAHHLAWGYVDQPPLVPFVAWIVDGVAGPSAFALRVLPALAGTASIVVTALMARELGGGRVAQTLGALAAATSPVMLGAFHLLSTAAFDTFLWSVLTFTTLRLVRTGNARLWIVFGGVLGFGMLNKLNIGFLAVALVVGVASGRGRRLLRSPCVLVGALLALLLSVPDLMWNATHDWAQVAMMHSLHQENGGTGAALSFLPAQVLVVGPVLVVFWVGGLVTLARDRTGVGRPFAVCYVILVVGYAVSGGKPYYLAGIYFVLFAAGGVYAERRLAARHRTGRIRGWIALMVAGAVLALPLALPVLPASTLPQGSWEGQINKDLSATVGWPDVVRQIATVADRLPADQRSRLVILTGDYGAAGAVDLYGSEEGLPPAVSGHNAFWWWGPGQAPAHSTTIAVDLPRTSLETMFTSVVSVGTVHTPGGVWTEERGDPVLLCTGQRESWARAWPGFRHYG